MMMMSEKWVFKLTENIPYPSNIPVFFTIVLTTNYKCLFSPPGGSVTVKKDAVIVHQEHYAEKDLLERYLY